MFFKQLYLITFKLRPLLKYIWTFKNTALLIYCFQHNIPARFYAVL